jgi:hypothetical protein
LFVVPLLNIPADQEKVEHSQEPFKNASNGNVATNGTAVHTAAEHEGMFWLLWCFFLLQSKSSEMQ